MTSETEYRFELGLHVEPDYYWRHIVLVVCEVVLNKNSVYGIDGVHSLRWRGLHYSVYFRQ